MKLRYIALGLSVFFWSTVISAILTDYFDVITVFDRPVMYFVILFSGCSIGYGIAKAG